MERKSPFVLIGAAVLAFVAAIAAFIVWKVGRAPTEQLAYYKVMFDVDVQDLTRDSPVFYRGIRVGRVYSIGLEKRDEPRRGDGRLVKVEKIAVVVAVPAEIEIHDRTRAVFEKPLVAGASFIQLIGKSERL